MSIRGRLVAWLAKKPADEAERFVAQPSAEEVILAIFSPPSGPHEVCQGRAGCPGCYADDEFDHCSCGSAFCEAYLEGYYPE